MIYYSLNKKAPSVSFKEALIRGLAPDRGLYFPSKIEKLPDSFFENINALSINEIAYSAISSFVKDEIPKRELNKIISETLEFDFPIIQINDNISTMELFQGPTLAFKDVGARFMARCLGYFNQGNKNQKITVLVATSGDTGGAVADGFLGVEGVNVVILYPKGKVSEIQEKQLTTLGQNITSLEVEGSFDDCQEMVKTAFLDEEIKKYIKLTSANSINIARWLPQMFYYFFAYRELKKIKKPIVISVPSGNYGNICAGMLAKKMGLPIDHFIASTNINDVVPRYLSTNTYDPKAPTQTISNAMDVGDPSNFIRIQKIHENNFEKLKLNLSGYRFTDEQTINGLKEIYMKSKYIADPHGAIGYLGLKDYLEKNKNKYGLFMETAHPVKFLKIVEETLGVSIPIPNRIKRILTKKKKSIQISNFTQLKESLLK
mgnify:CR=1 FL=1